jgi:hypothetical protein
MIDERSLISIMPCARSCRSSCTARDSLHMPDLDGAAWRAIADGEPGSQARSSAVASIVVSPYELHSVRTSSAHETATPSLMISNLG